jgi:hypothetical protein
MVMVAVAVSLTACSSVPVGVHASSSGKPTASSEAVRVFTGTPDEWAAEVRGCLEQHGVATEATPNEPGAFSYDPPPGMTVQQTQAIGEECQKSVGQPSFSNMSEDQLKVAYQARVDQWNCLVKAGLASGPVQSFDVFLSDYERSGRKTLWEPTNGLQAVVNNGVRQGPSDVCPRVGTTW